MYTTEFNYASLGLVLGISAGLSPGPLMTLVITESLRYSFRSGAQVALAPLVTDLPIVLFSVLIIASLSSREIIMSALSVAGALYMFYLAKGVFSSASMGFTIETPCINLSLKRGVVANILNPSPYIFWITLGSPAVLEAWANNRLASILFVGFFYVSLIGSKILIAFLSVRSREALKGEWYSRIMRFMGFLLVLFAARLLFEAFSGFKKVF